MPVPRAVPVGRSRGLLLRTNIGPRSSPARVAPGRLTGTRGRGPGVADERWFYTDDADWAAVAERLKTTAVPALPGRRHPEPARHPDRVRRHRPRPRHPRAAGVLQQPWPPARMRADRYRLGGRDHPPAQPDRPDRRGIPPSGRRRDPHGRRPGHRRPPERPDVPAGLAAVRPRPVPDPDGPVRPRPAARSGAGRAVPPIVRRPRPGPPARHLPDHRLPDHRLPAGDPDVLPVTDPGR